jgi:hypothetical protein
MTPLRKTQCWKGLLRASGLLRRIFPLTRVGAALAMVDGFALWAEGLRHQNLVVLGAAAVVLAIQCGLTLVVVASGFIARYSSRRQGTSEKLDLDSGRSQATGFAVSFPAWLPFVTLHWDWRQPDGINVETRREQGQLREYIRPRHRLASDSIQRQFRCGDFLGLAEVSWLAEEQRSIRVLPSRAGSGALALRAGLAQGSELADPAGGLHGSLTEMREYRPGDSPRLIRWKLFAHTRKLIVRTPEPAFEDSPNSCAWLAGAPSSEAASRLVREALEGGMLGDQWGFGASGTQDLILGDMERARDTIARSGSADEMTAEEILRFLCEAELAGFSACYLFLSADAPGLAAKLKQISRQTSLDLHAVFAVSGADDFPERAGRIHRLFWRPRTGRQDKAVLTAAVSRLSSFFSTSVLCDVTSGE